MGSRYYDSGHAQLHQNRLVSDSHLNKKVAVELYLAHSAFLVLTPLKVSMKEDDNGRLIFSILARPLQIPPLEG